MGEAGSGKLLLVFSQTFVPDPASVGQHMADVAVEMARRGWRVRVYTSERGYENPNVRYPKRENLHGVDVRRLGWASFGKKNILTRVIGTFSFLLQCIFIGLFTRKVGRGGGIFFSTSPPLIGIAACIVKFFRRMPIAYWAMDLNPDQLIVMGKVKEGSFTARLLEFVNGQILERADWIFALDIYMAGRILKRGDYEKKMSIAPPWPHEDHLEAPPRGENPFRAKHQLQGRFVVMYSGNHSPANPLATLLQAAERLKDEEGLAFLFVGGGLGKKEVEAAIREKALKQVISLPYQPLAELGNSLSAADVHVVSLGEEMVGVIHPCKIYGAMSIGRPVLFLGPGPSHVSDILLKEKMGWHVRHGDVDATVRVIQEMRATSAEELDVMGRRGQEYLRAHFSQKMLCGQFCDALESALQRGGRP